MKHIEKINVKNTFNNWASTQLKQSIIYLNNFSMIIIFWFQNLIQVPLKENQVKQDNVD